MKYKNIFMNSVAFALIALLLMPPALQMSQVFAHAASFTASVSNGSGSVAKAGASNELTVSITPNPPHSIGSIEIIMGAVGASAWGTPAVLIDGFSGKSCWVINSATAGNIKISRGTGTNTDTGVACGAADNLQVGSTMNVNITVDAPSIEGSSSWSVVGSGDTGFGKGHQGIVSPSVFVDGTPPVTSMLSAIDGNGVDILNIGATSSPDITLNFSAIDNSAVHHIDCGLTRTNDIFFVDPTANPCALGTFPFLASLAGIVSYNGLAGGEYTFTASATDIAGNVETTATFTWKVGDSTAPVITCAIEGTQGNLVTGVSNSPCVTDETKGDDSWYVEGEDSGDVTLTFDIQENESDIASASDGCGTISIVDSKHWIGTQTITVDTFGVVITCIASSDGPDGTESVHVYRDTAKPTVTIDTANVSDADESGARTATYTASANDNSDVAGFSSTLSCTPTSPFTIQPNTDVTVTCTATDPAGNVSTEGTTTVSNLFVVGATVTTIAPGVFQLQTEPTASNPDGSSTLLTFLSPPKVKTSMICATFEDDGTASFQKADCTGDAVREEIKLKDSSGNTLVLAPVPFGPTEGTDSTVKCETSAGTSVIVSMGTPPEGLACISVTATRIFNVGSDQFTVVYTLAKGVPLEHRAILPPGTSFTLVQRWDLIADHLDIFGTDLTQFNGPTGLGLDYTGVTFVGPGSFKNDPTGTDALLKNADHDKDGTKCGDTTDTSEKFESCIMLGNYVVDTFAKALELFDSVAAKNPNAYNNLAVFLLTYELNLERGTNNCGIVDAWNADRLLFNANYQGPVNVGNPPGPLKTESTNAKKVLETIINNGCGEFSLGIKRVLLSDTDPAVQLLHGGTDVITEQLNKVGIDDIKTLISSNPSKFVEFTYGPLAGGSQFTPFLTSTSSNPNKLGYVQTGTASNGSCPSTPTSNDSSSNPRKVELPNSACNNNNSWKRMYYEAPLASTLQGKTITKIELKNISSRMAGTTRGCDIRGLNGGAQPSGAMTTNDLWTAIGGGTVGSTTYNKVYPSADTLNRNLCGTAASTTYTTGRIFILYQSGTSTNALTDLQTQLNSGKFWFAVGLKFQSETFGNAVRLDVNSTPSLVITYS